MAAAAEDFADRFDPVLISLWIRALRGVIYTGWRTEIDPWSPSKHLAAVGAPGDPLKSYVDFPFYRPTHRPETEIQETRAGSAAAAAAEEKKKEPEQEPLLEWRKIDR